jgi:hypothetical protein
MSSGGGAALRNDHGTPRLTIVTLWLKQGRCSVDGN